MMQPALIHTALNEDQRKQQVSPLLKQGLGIEDIAVKTGLPEQDIRDCIAYWRRYGFLARVLEARP